MMTMFHCRVRLSATSSSTVGIILFPSRSSSLIDAKKAYKAEVVSKQRRTRHCWIYLARYCVPHGHFSTLLCNLFSQIICLQPQLCVAAMPRPLSQ
jgi:hypothetical protein